MKEKPLLPTLRERKRYLVYEVISKHDFDARDVSQTIRNSMKDVYGLNGLADAGLMFMDKKFSESKQRGFVRVSHQSLDKLRASFTFVSDINGKKAIIKSVIASGMINKAEEALSAS